MSPPIRTPARAGSSSRPSSRICGPNDPAVQEEIFGPVLSVQNFETEEEAVELPTARSSA
jgi:hypothetical protein